MSRRDWIEQRIALLKRRLAGPSVPPGFNDHKIGSQLQELVRLRRELAELDQQETGGDAA